MSLKGKNLGLRTVSGAVMGVIVVGAVLWGAWPTAIMASLVCVGAMTELVELATKRIPEVWAPYILVLCFGVAWIVGVALNGGYTITSGFYFFLYPYGGDYNRF